LDFDLIEISLHLIKSHTKKLNSIVVQK